MNIGEYLAYLRLTRGLSQRGLAIKMGVSHSSVSKVESGERKPKLEMLEKFALALNADLEVLIAILQGNEKADSYNLEKEKIKVDMATRIPIVGTVRAGIPILAIENIEGYLTLDISRLGSDKDYYGLRIKGDSMDKRFNNGAVIVVEKTEAVENGQIAVVGINGNEATVKKVMFAEGNIALIPESNNPAHITQVYNIKNDDIHIFGRVVQSIAYH